MVFHVCIAVIAHLIRINEPKLPHDLSFHCFLPFKSVNNLVQQGGNIAHHSSGLQLKSLRFPCMKSIHSLKQYGFQRGGSVQN